MIKDLAPWSNGVKFAEKLAKAEKLFANPGAHAWCHYVIKDNRIYRKCYGQHVGFSMFWDSVLGWFTRHTNLPDLEIMVNLGDWPLIKEKNSDIPMFSWCGSQDTQWEEKEEKMFWKGRDSRRERLDLIKISRKHPELINASITNWFFFRDEMEEYGGRSSPVPFFSFFNYKYQLNIDGTVAAYRLKQKYLLRTNYSVVQDQILWAKANDDKVLEISRNAQQFVLDNLLPHQVLCYHAHLLNLWAGLLRKSSVYSSHKFAMLELELTLTAFI
ncbi:KDEL motif-containing protein 1 [Eurytemora carolleeae]|uniref:KDEL motif-containing protein 1 n=1 Tax=Eurytemora carolleeae TaxID=1294199 RepID=UPI000C782A23|nr:KDEL motif-containing protein 1 [Eurytemora carolleeae]|eukprot:XP_023342472.1 KDEL motif-containing protein 1-like [Eurytemora affinis]